MAIKSRSYFSIPYLCGAARYAREARSFEASAPTDELNLIHRAYVVSAITASVAALEAMINEVFADATEPNGGCIAALPIDARSKLATLWRIPRTSRYSILDKFDVGHLLVTGRGLDRSQHWWCNVSWVVRLRNQFVHFEPSWQDHGAYPSDDMSKIERALTGQFQENRLAGSANSFYPDRMLGHGCAAWSITSTLEFADNFWQSIAVPPPYQAYRQMFVSS